MFDMSTRFQISQEVSIHSKPNDGYSSGFYKIPGDFFMGIN